MKIRQFFAFLEEVIPLQISEIECKTKERERERKRETERGGWNIPKKLILFPRTY